MIDKADFPSAEAYAFAAWLLGCEPRAMQAVAIVEAGKEGAFLPTDEPVVLFERHLFNRLTDGRHVGARVPLLPGENHEPWHVIAWPSWGGYGPYSVQHRRLQAAVALDRDAALKSSSWGLFQILGSNHAACGYPELQRFVTAMYRSVDDHLRAFVQFIRHDKRLVDAIRARNWPAFARVYNGPLFAKHGYERRLAAAYDKLPADAA